MPDRNVDPGRQAAGEGRRESVRGPAHGTAGEPAREVTRGQWLSLLVLSLGLAIVIIDSTIVNVAIPSIQQEFNASLKNLEWVNSIYSLVYAALIVTWGRIGDQIGRKRIFIAGVIVFVLGSALAGASQSISFLIGARTIQGLGAAMTSPSTLSIISATFTGRMRGVAFGVWGAVAGAAAALGPLLGGWLTTSASWRWAFYVNLPIGVAAILGALFVLSESRQENARLDFDIPGIILVALGIGGIVFGLIEGQSYGWWQPRQSFSLGSWNWPLADLSITPVSFAVGLAGLVAFVAWEQHLRSRGQEPLFDFSLLRFRSFRFGLTTVAIVAVGEFAVVFVLSLYLQGVLGLSAFDTGLTLLPFALATLVVAPSAGFLSARFGPKWVVTSGMLLEATAIFLLSRIIGLTAARGTLIAVLVVYGAGVGLAIAQLTNVVLNEIPSARLGAASGANNTIRQVGASMGIAVVGAVLATQMAAAAQAQFATVSSVPAPVKTAIVQGLEESGGGEGLSTVPGTPAGLQDTPGGQAMAKTITHVIQQSFVDGARASAVTASIFVLLGALSSLFIPNPGPRRSKGVVPAE